MAHNVTRIEGFEGGETVGSTSLFLSAITGTPEVVAAAARSGGFGLRIIAPAAGNESGSLALAWASASGSGAPDLVTDIEASISRLYVRFVALSGPAELFALKDPANANVVRVDITAAGLLELDDVAGTTVLSLDTWYRLELKSDGVTGCELWLNDVLEASSATSTFANRLSLGKSSAAGGAGGYTAHFDDIEIESSEDGAADIDFPGPGKILLMGVDGDGFYDGSWTATTDPNAYLSVVIPDNADTDRVLSVADSLSNQSFTLETVAGIAEPIHALQYSAIVKRIGGDLDESVGLLLRHTVTDELMNATVATTSYAPYGRAMQLSPFTGVAWTNAELVALQAGFSQFLIT